MCEEEVGSGGGCVRRGGKWRCMCEEEVGSGRYEEVHV